MILAGLVVAALAMAAGGVFVIARYGPTGNPLADLARSIWPGASSCPGDSGPNSDWEPMVRKQYLTPVLDDGTGKLISLSELMDETFSDPLFAGSKTDGASLMQKSIDEALSRDHSSHFVPEGGDARFARAVCDIVSRLSPSLTSVRRYVSGRVSLPSLEPSGELLRASGRSTCQAALEGANTPGEEYWSGREAESRRAQDDPEAYKAKALADLDQVISGPGATTAKEEKTLTLLRKHRDQISSLSAKDLADSTTASFRITQAAFLFQCPRQLALGHGPTCGEFTGRGFSGVVHLRNDKTDCDDALRLLDVLYGKSTDSVDGLPYRCRNANDSEKKILHVTCGSSGRDSRWDPTDPEGVVVAKTRDS